MDLNLTLTITITIFIDSDLNPLWGGLIWSMTITLCCRGSGNGYTFCVPDNRKICIFVFFKLLWHWTASNACQHQKLLTPKSFYFLLNGKRRVPTIQRSWDVFIYINTGDSFLIDICGWSDQPWDWVMTMLKQTQLCLRLASN